MKIPYVRVLLHRKEEILSKVGHGIAEKIVERRSDSAALDRKEENASADQDDDDTDLNEKELKIGMLDGSCHGFSCTDGLSDCRKR